MKFPHFNVSLLASFISLFSAAVVQADPVISEFMASNTIGIKDGDGQRNDWIEIYNPDQTPVNLLGWHLTDNKTSKGKWTFPSVVVPAKSYLLVWASNKNLAVAGAELHTNFKIASGGGYLALTKPDLSVAHEFDPYPIQAPDVGYGVPITKTDSLLVDQGAAAKVNVPTDGSLGTSWTTTGFADTTWQDTNIGVGYDVEQPPLESARLWADSVTEFSGNQGQNNWFYGYWNKTTDTDKVYTPAEATLFLRDGTNTVTGTNQWDGGTWDVNPSGAPWSQLAATGGHPNGANNGAEHWVMRRYVSEFTGEAHIVGNVFHSGACGDGDAVRIFVDGRQIYYRPFFGTTVEFSVNATVQLGSKVDFFIDPGEAANDGCDSFSSTFKVYSGALADSVADWTTSGAQGARGWTYGYYRKSTDTDGIYQPADFTSFLRNGTAVVGVANSWDGTQFVLSTTTAPLTALNANGGRPQVTGATDWPIRRWTSTFTGRVRIAGVVGHPGTAGSDGITGRLLVNGTQIYSKTVNNYSEGYTVFADVVPGTLVDFAIDPGTTDTADETAVFTGVISPTNSGATIVADSITGWAGGAQGTNGWNYGYYNKSADGNAVYDAADFNSTDANWTLSGVWVLGPGNPPWTELGQVGAHPNGAADGSTQHWAVRRWTSTVAGSLSVDVHVAKSNGAGNGVTLKVFHNGTEKESFAIAGTDKIGAVRCVALQSVAVGDKIDIALTPVGPAGAQDDGADGSNFSARIIRNTSSPNTTLALLADSIADWSTAGVQGYKGWTYGYYNKTTDGDGIYQANNLTPFPRDSGGYSATNFWNGSGYDWYAGNPPWTELGQYAVHPNGTNNAQEHWVVRRWTSTVTGAVSVSYKVQKTNGFGGGVGIRAFHNNLEKDSVMIAGGDTAGTTRTFVIPSIGIGDTIDVCLTPVGLGGTDDGSDGSAFSVNISKLTQLSDGISSTGQIQSIMRDINSSAYVRVPFTLATLPTLDSMKLKIRYDDGFVAYLNGSEIARRNAPMTQTGGLLANSVTEHSGVQGQANWFYGYYPKGADLDGIYNHDTDFITNDPNWTFSGGTWLLGPGDPPWTFLNSTGGHPNGTNSGIYQLAMKRWTAEVTGSMSVHIRLAHPGGCSSGTTARLYLNGVSVWSQAVNSNDATGYWGEVFLPDVKVGDHLDLGLDSVGIDGDPVDSCDGTTFYMSIDQAPASGLAWNSKSVQSRATALVGTPEEIDLSAFRSLLNAGTNVLAIHGLNASTGDLDFLLAPQVVGSVTSADPNTKVYFLTPTPNSINGVGSTNLGPIITDVTDSPAVADADNIVVLATVKQSIDPVGPVRLRWRVMYGPETEVQMFDDGAHADGLAGDKIYAATIPSSASAPGEMVRWRVTAEDSTGDISKSPAFADATSSPEYWGTVVQVPNVVSGGQLPVLHWFTSNTGGADTTGGSRGSVFYNGQFLDNVLSDLHGQSSTGFPKKSYDFHLNTGYKLEWDSTPGNNTPKINSFNLLTTYPDKSNIRNMLAYDVFEKAGAAGHFVVPIQVRRNNAFFSVAHFVEDGDEDFLQRETTLDDQGALYKMYNTFYDPAGGEKKSRKWEGNQDLSAFMTGLAQTGVAQQRFVFDNTGVPETVNFLAAHIMTGNDDCCHKNYYVYRDSEGNREWRPIPWDLDLSFGRVWRGDTTYFGDNMVSDTSLYVGNGNQFMQIFNNGSVPALRQMFLRRLRTLADTILNPSSMPEAQRYFEGRIDTFKALVKPEADYERGLNLWPTWGISQDMNTAVDIMRNQYLPARRTYVFSQPELPAAQSPTVVVNFGTVEFDPASHNQAEEYFTLTNSNAEAVDVSGWTIIGAVNHTLKPGTVIPSGGTLYLSPDVNAFRARTTGPGGNQGLFIQGNYNGQLSARGETLTLMDGTRIVATTTYTGAPSAAQSSLRVTEIMYHPPTTVSDTLAQEEYEYIELRNIGASPVSLNGVYFNNGITFNFTSGTMAPSAFAVLVKNPTAFAERYPTITPAGTFTGSLDNAGERIVLMDANNEEIHDFVYEETWHPLTDGLGFSLQVVNQAALTDDWSLSTQWKPSGKLYGTPGADDSVGDTDGDLIPDLWEVQHGLDPLNPADAALDNDGDGASNLQEYLAGTNPNSPQSVLTANGAGFAPGGAYLGTFQAVAGKTYTVQYSNDLLPNGWHKISDHSPTVDGIVPFTDAGAASSNRRFYRVITPIQP